MEELLHIAGLLYMHAIWQDFPFAALGRTKLLSRLKELLTVVEIGKDRDESLILWMMFVGAISAPGKGGARIWFIAQLQGLTEELKFNNWAEVKAKLEVLWWVEKIHGKLCRGVWEEVVVLSSVLIPADGSLSLD